MSRTMSRPIAMVSLALLLASVSTVQVGSGAVAQEVPEPTAINVEASAEINKSSLDLQGPVSRFNVLLPTVGSHNHRPAVVENGTGAEFSLNRVDPGDATLRTEVEDGTDVEVVEDDQGDQSIQLTDANGEIVGGIVIEATRSSNGEPVHSELALEGETITPKFVAGNDEVKEPVSVDVYASTVWYNKGWVTKKSGKKYVVNLDPTRLGRKQNALNTHKTHVKHAKKVLGSANTKKYWNYNIEQQFLCHVVGAWFPTGVYNMESWRPTKKWRQIANPFDRCNRK